MSEVNRSREEIWRPGENPKPTGRHVLIAGSDLTVSHRMSFLGLKVEMTAHEMPSCECYCHYQ